MALYDPRTNQPTIIPIGSMYGIYGNIYHQYTPNVGIYTIHGSYGIVSYLSLPKPCQRSHLRLAVLLRHLLDHEALLSVPHFSPRTPLGSATTDGGFDSHGGTPKWMVYKCLYWKTLLNMDDLGGTCILGNLHMSRKPYQSCKKPHLAVLTQLKKISQLGLPPSN